MKFKANTFLITMAVVLGMTAFSFPVSANVPTTEEISVNDNVESKNPLTPSGNMTSVDDIHQVADEDTIEDKQFITVETKNGNTFYIIIDRSGDTENVYFLNAVDESDLMALMEDEEKEVVTAVCTCTDKCELGSVNENCDVCSKDKNKCAGTAMVSAHPEATEEPENKQNNSSLAVIILLILLGGGGAFYWFKIKNKKTSTKGTTDPNDLEDEDYETEDEEPETDTDTEYETDEPNDETDFEDEELSEEESEEKDE